MKKVIFFALSLALGLILAASARAATFVLPRDTNANQSNLSINQPINHTLFSLGHTLTINGLVKGDAFVLADTILFKQPVERNIFSFAQKLTIEKEVGGSVVAAGSNITIEKPIKGNLLAVGENITINSDIQGDVLVSANQLTLAKNITIGGDLYSSAGKITKPDSVAIRGKTKIKISGAKTKPTLTQRIHAALFALLSLLVLGTAAWFFFPKIALEITKNITTHWSNSLLWGFIILIATPFTALLLLLTTIGWSLSLILIAGYILAIALAPIYVGLAISKNLFKLPLHPIFQILIGLSIIILITNLSVIGALFKLIIITLGLGAGALALKEKYHTLKTKL